MKTITLKEIVSHPAYEQYIVNVDVERIRLIVTLHDLMQSVTDKVTRFGLSKRVPADGGFEHYKECIWSNVHCQSGPDTCICCYVSVECDNILQLLDKLYNEDCRSSGKDKCKQCGFYETL